MIKIGSAEVNAMMIKAAGILRSQQEKIKELEQDLANRNRASHAEKIASAAVERGIMDPDDAAEYAHTLANGQKDLEMVEEFVSRTTPGVPLVAGLAKTASAETNSGGEVDVLTSYLLSTDVP
jgi:hypothetical protein